MSLQRSGPQTAATLSHEQIQTFLDADVSKALYFLSKTQPMPPQVNVREVVRTLHMGKLSICPEDAFAGGTFPKNDMTRRASCNILASLAYMALTAVQVGGMAFAFMLIDKYMLCSTYTEYLKGIVSWVTTQHDTCVVYVQTANQLKHAITTVLAGVNITNFRSRYNALYCSMKGCCDGARSSPTPVPSSPTQVPSSPTQVPSSPNRQTKRRSSPTATSPRQTRSRARHTSNK
jgi:hypothetical protein